MGTQRMLVAVCVVALVFCACGLEAQERERDRRPSKAEETAKEPEQEPEREPAKESKTEPAKESKTEPAKESKTEPAKAPSPQRILADGVKVEPAKMLAAALKEAPGTAISFSLEKSDKGVVARIVVVGQEEIDGDRCRVVRVDAASGKVLSAGSLQAELPAERRRPLRIRGLWEGFEEALMWRLSSWSPLAGLITDEREKTEGAKSLLIRLQDAEEVKISLTRSVVIDLQGATFAKMDVFSANGGGEISLAFACRRDRWYQESSPVVLKKGWNRDIAVDLNGSDYKNQATNWEYRARLAGADEVYDIYIVLKGSTAVGDIHVDNIRFVDEVPAEGDALRSPVTRLRTITDEELLVMSSHVTMADAVAKASEVGKGTPISVRLVTRRGYVFFEVDVLPGDSDKTSLVGVDAGTGLPVTLKGLEQPSGRRRGPRRIPPGQRGRGRMRQRLEEAGAPRGEGE